LVRGRRPLVKCLAKPADNPVVWCRSRMDSSAQLGALPDDSLRRQRAKERLYVLAQTAGWMGMLTMQLVFIQWLGREDKSLQGRNAGTDFAVMVLFGWLLSHYVRPFMTRWGWKELDWRWLIPRVFGMAGLMSLVWVAGTCGYRYGVLQEPWPPKISHALVLTISWLNGEFIFGTWLGLYFFYHLFDRFNRLEVERFRLLATVKEAELRALKSQVNPHFIFNSLNSLRALIDENPARARAAVTQLANLLRYSLQSGQHETVTLEEELRVVNDYLALEQVRHEDRLRVQIDVSAEAAAAPVPPMLVQTLVENAVKYGIAPRREGGEIAILARCSTRGLRLRVTNPGTLARPGGRSAGPGSTGMGLANAAERLRLLFGDRARLELREEPAGLVVAEVEVPSAPARPETLPAAAPVPSVTEV